MIQPPRALSARRFYLFVLIFLVLTDLAIILDVPALRPFLGFLFFTIIPGLLILQALRLNQLDLTERLVLSVGLSVAFIMFAGLFINTIFPLLGYNTPLSTISVMVSFSIILIIVAIIGYKRNRDFAFNLSGFNLDVREKAFLLLPALLPLLSIAGVYLMNTTGDSKMLVVMLFLIPVYVIFLAVRRHHVPPRTYPVMIFLIGISLLLLMALRSNHIIGNDTHEEYYYFQLVASSQRWQISTGGLLNSTLSISLLPAAYQSLMSVDGESLFKILYPLLFSISPLVVYIISRKYLGDFLAFLAAFFFMSQLNFFWTPALARNNMAILFFALIIMALYNDNIGNPARRFLIIVFAASCIVSHYTTTYIVFLALLLTWTGMKILSVFTGRKLDQGVNLTFVVLFLALLFLWYSYIVPITFRSGVGYTYRTFASLSQLFVLETRGTAVAEAYGQTLATSGIPARIKFVVFWLSIAVIAIGVLSTLARYKSMVTLLNIKRDSVSFLKSKIDAEYWMLALASCAILALSVILPYALHGYGMNREYLQMMTVLSMFIVIGAVVTGKLLKSKAYWLILVVLVPYFLCNSGVIDKIFGVKGDVILNSEGPGFAYYYIYDQEGYSARWLKDNSSPEGRVIETDRAGAVRLVSQGGILERGGTPVVKLNEYLYLTYNNVVNKKLVIGNSLQSIEEWQDKFTGKNKIYANGGSEIYR